MADILQKYLSLGLLDIGDDDSRLEKLRGAAADLQQRFVSEPRLALYHVLMAFSPNVSADDACFVEDNEALQPHWATYKNRHPDVPREIFRAISLQAVMAAAESSPPIKASVTYGLRSLPEHPVSQKDGLLLQELYETLEADLETRTTELWRLNISGQPGAATPAAPTINKDEATTFDTMADAVDKGFKVVTAPLSGVVAAQGALRNLTINAAQRSELIWWRQSLYSPLLGRSYRDVPNGVAALYMAIDLENQIGRIAPMSVDFFLREAVREILPEGSSVALAELISQITGEGLTTGFLASTPGASPRIGVKTIVEALRDELQPGAHQSQKTSRARSKGEKAKPIDLPQLSVRVHLELQALRGTAGKADGKKV